ncbi:MAG: DUF4143 domain-containing protein [Ruminobacter sp.]|nr:DUF4143 domain-containing protein [Ruminobacter sp.]
MKTYLLDVGLLRKEFKLPLHAISEDKRIFTEYNCALTENFVLEHLVTQFDMPRFWYTLNPSRTIDFLIQKDNLIIPIEVKNTSSPRNKVLQKFAEI